MDLNSFDLEFIDFTFQLFGIFHTDNVLPEDVAWNPDEKRHRRGAGALNRHVAVISEVQHRDDTLLDVQAYPYLTCTLMKHVDFLTVQYFTFEVFPYE